MWSIKNDVELQNYLEPHQISVGTAGGLEAGVYAFSTYTIIKTPADQSDI